jgi:hypothetical protein
MLYPIELRVRSGRDWRASGQFTTTRASSKRRGGGRLSDSRDSARLIARKPLSLNPVRCRKRQRWLTRWVCDYGAAAAGARAVFRRVPAAPSDGGPRVIRYGRPIPAGRSESETAGRRGGGWGWGWSMSNCHGFVVLGECLRRTGVRIRIAVGERALFVPRITGIGCFLSPCLRGGISV